MSKREIRQVVVLLTLPLTIAGAQSSAQSMLAGAVRDSAGRIVAGVDVSIPILRRSVRTDGAGRFRIGGLTPGDYSLRARRVGFLPMDLRATVAGDSTELSIVMIPTNVTLDTVVVTSRCPWRGYDGFVCRQRGGHGVFLDQVAIDSAKADQVGDLFFGQQGFRVAVNPKGIKSPVATTGWLCVVTIVDGLAANPFTNPIPIRADEIVAVEIYEKPNDVPKAYEQYSWIKNGHPDRRCGLVVYWRSKNH